MLTIACAAVSKSGGPPLAVMADRICFYDKTKKPGSNFTPVESDDLLAMNMHCRNIWTNFFKKKAFDFDKVFSSEEIERDNI